VASEQPSTGSGDRRRSDVRDQAAAFYLQVVAIIQSFALGFLLTAVGDRLKNDPLTYALRNVSATNTLVVWLQIIAVFNVVVMTWALSAHGVIQFKRDMTLADSYYPFVLGVSQFFLVHFIGVESTNLWFLALAMFSITAACMQDHVNRRRIAVPQNKAGLAMLRKFRLFGGHINTFLIFFMTAWSVILLVGGLSPLSADDKLRLLVCVIVGLGILIAVICLMLKHMARRPEAASARWSRKIALIRETHGRQRHSGKRGDRTD
jgi:hypothetical protein